MFCTRCGIATRLTTTVTFHLNEGIMSTRNVAADTQCLCYPCHQEIVTEMLEYWRDRNARTEMKDLSMIKATAPNPAP